MRNDPHVSVSVLWPTLRWTSVQESARLAQTWSANSAACASPPATCFKLSARWHCHRARPATNVLGCTHSHPQTHVVHRTQVVHAWITSDTEQCIPQLQYEWSIARCDQWPAHWPKRDSFTAERSIRELGRWLLWKQDVSLAAQYPCKARHGHKILHQGGGKRILQAQCLTSLARPASSSRVQWETLSQEIR